MPLGQFLQLGDSIAQDAFPTIGTTVSDVEILSSKLGGDDLTVQQSTSSPIGGDPAVDTMVLVPGLAGAGPGQALVDFVAVAHKLVGDVLARRDRVDVLAGNLAKPAQDVVGRPGHARNQTAVADGGVGAREDEIVGERWAGQAEVALRFVFPFLRQCHLVAPRHRVVRNMRHVEPRGTYNHVDLVVLSALGFNPCPGDAFDRRGFKRHAGEEEAFQVALARGQAAAAEFPGWNEFVAQIFVVVERGLHATDGDFGRVLVLGGSFFKLYREF